MERREFIKIVCSLVGAWPIAAYAQQGGELRRIGVLGADATVGVLGRLLLPPACENSVGPRERLSMSIIAGLEEAPSV